jgi:aminobenzoyl-glutamate utilization protein B
MDKKEIFDYIDKNQAIFTEVSDTIWGFAETAFDEYNSMDLYYETLEKLGFKTERGVGDVPTAFVGTYGSGHPVIGILSEYDALARLSQEAGVTEEKPIVEGASGHGCSHNVLGAGSLGAAAAIKEYLAQNNRQGTVKFFGCPGEEGGSGKTFMARAGVFDDVDFTLTWHPHQATNICNKTNLANYQVLYKFIGRSSHAAMYPEEGRSALDAVELMNVAVNFLREHVVQEARIHYAITDAGGFSPNVVQPKADVLYLMRAPRLQQVEEIYQRINKIAEGMAMATETEVEIKFIKASANTIINTTLLDVIYKNMQDIGVPAYTDEEIIYAKRLDETCGSKLNFKVLANVSDEEAANLQKCMEGKHLFDSIIPFDKNQEIVLESGSSDVGDVSWNVPNGEFRVTCQPLNSLAHTWQIVAISCTSIAHKGLIYAAKIMAGTAIDALEDNSIIQEAKAEHKRRLGGSTYVCPIPMEVKPMAINKI